MFSFPSLYELSTSDSYDHIILQGLFSTLPPPSDVGNQSLSPRSTAEAKAAAASNSHKEAERKRRKRISGHFATLKSILPTTAKTDKASLLGEAVRRVRELKKTAEEIAGGDDLSDASFNLMLPSEADELKLSLCDDGGGAGMMIKATLCCEDRPEMVLDLIQGLKSVQARAVRAEMSTVGGRTKIALWVKMNGGGSVEGESDVCLGILRRALKVVVDKSSMLVGNNQQGLPGNKRPRYYHLC